MNEKETQGFIWAFGQRKGLFSLPDIEICFVTGKEFGNDKKSIMKGAIAHLDVLRKSKSPFYNIDTGWNLVVTRIGWKKIANNPEQTVASLCAIFAIEQLAQRAVLAESHQDNKHQNPNVQGIHRMYAAIEIGGLLYRVKLTVRDYSSVRRGTKTNLHALEAISIEPFTEKEKAPLGTLPSALVGGGTAQPTTERIISIAHLLEKSTRECGSEWEVAASIEQMSSSF